MARHGRGLAGAFEGRLPAQGAGRARIVRIGRGGARLHPPAGGGSARPLMTPWQQQDDRHTMPAGRERQAARGGEADILQLGHDETDRGGAYRLLDDPERIGQLAGFGMQDRALLTHKGGQARLQQPAMFAPQGDLPDPEDGAGCGSGSGQGKAGHCPHIAKAGLTDFMDAFGAELERKGGQGLLRLTLKPEDTGYVQFLGLHMFLFCS